MSGTMECSETTAGSNEAGSPAKQLEEVKSPPSERATSPETNCAICLGNPQNKSFTDSCLHQFCFTCLLEWSKVKAECPLCKQSFTSIIHTVRSIEDYEQYYVHPAEQVNISVVEDNSWRETPFRYRTTMTSILEYYIRLDGGTHIIPPAPPRSFHNWRRRRQHGTSDFRRNVYTMNLWVQRMRDITGRYRESSPEFYRLNPVQLHRLVPWLNRELIVLLEESMIEPVLTIILNLLKEHYIRSRPFRDAVFPYFGSRTDHFIHEFHSFATSVYDMIGYDRHSSYVDYFYIAHELDPSSSSSGDSDVQIVSETVPIDTTRSLPGPSIEVMSESETDDCLIVGTVKPRHERTPEIITIDSDVEAQEPPTICEVATDSSEIDCLNPGPSCSYNYKTRSKMLDKNYFSFKNNYPGSDSSLSSVIVDHHSNRRKKYQAKNVSSHPRFILFSDSSSSVSSDENDSNWSDKKEKKSHKSKKKKTNKEKDSTKKKHSAKDSKRKNKAIEKHWKKKICQKSNNEESEDSGPVQIPRRRKSVVLNSSPEPDGKLLQDHDYQLANPYTNDDVQTQTVVNNQPRPRLRSVVVKYESNQRPPQRYTSLSNSDSDTSRHDYGNDLESNSAKMNKWHYYRESSNSSVDSSSRKTMSGSSRNDSWLTRPSTSSNTSWLDRHYIDTLSSINTVRYNFSHNYRYNGTEPEEQSSAASSPNQKKRKHKSTDKNGKKNKKRKTIVSSET